MQFELPIILASTSARRKALLEEAGYEPIVCKPQIDDGLLSCGTMRVHAWVRTLAVLKAMDVHSQSKVQEGTILAADTVCVIDNVMFGQPESRSDAMRMLQRLENSSHQVCTGWCLLNANGDIRSGYEFATVSIGTIGKIELESYVSSGEWRGKAGAYNLPERVSAGWPILCEGDEASVMGLPIARLKKELPKGTLH